MKITNNDYQALKNQVIKLHSPEMKKKYAHFSEMAYRWEIFHQAVSRELKNLLWSYLDDDNIDTALRRIFKELA